MEENRMEQDKIVKNDRITVIDALRGFALLGVVLVHMQQHYSIFYFGALTPAEPLFPVLDEWINWLTRNVLMGRFINIFAFLFGMSFFIQMDRAAKKGVDFRRRFIWRMVILFLIGGIGSAFYSGDILSFYAIFGLILVLLHPLKNKVLIFIACLIIAGAPRWISYGYERLTTPHENVEMATSAQTPQRGPERPQPSLETLREEASITKTFQQNLTDGRMRTFNYQFNWGGRGYLTFALFIGGLVVGRIRFFETVHLHIRRNLILFVLFAAGAWLVGKAGNLLSQEQGFFTQGIPSATALLRMTLNDVNMVLFSAAITMGFCLLYQVKGIGKCLDVLAPYGRMGLTNYEMQGIIGSILFSLWGFGSLFGRWNATGLFGLGIALYVAQILFSRLWLTYFKYGPLEWLWRSATYLKWQPFRKGK